MSETRRDGAPEIQENVASDTNFCHWLHIYISLVDPTHNPADPIQYPRDAKLQALDNQDLIKAIFSTAKTAPLMELLLRVQEGVVSLDEFHQNFPDTVMFDYLKHRMNTRSLNPGAHDLIIKGIDYLVKYRIYTMQEICTMVANAELMEIIDRTYSDPLKSVPPAPAPSEGEMQGPIRPSIPSSVPSGFESATYEGDDFDDENERPTTVAPEPVPSTAEVYRTTPPPPSRVGPPPPPVRKQADLPPESQTEPQIDYSGEQAAYGRAPATSSPEITLGDSVESAETVKIPTLFITNSSRGIMQPEPFIADRCSLGTDPSNTIVVEDTSGEVKPVHAIIRRAADGKVYIRAVEAALKITGAGAGSGKIVTKDFVELEPNKEVIFSATATVNVPRVIYDLNGTYPNIQDVSDRLKSRITSISLKWFTQLVEYIESLKPMVAKKVEVIQHFEKVREENLSAAVESGLILPEAIAEIEGEIRLYQEQLAAVVKDKITSTLRSINGHAQQYFGTMNVEELNEDHATFLPERITPDFLYTVIPDCKHFMEIILSLQKACGTLGIYFPGVDEYHEMFDKEILPATKMLEFRIEEFKKFQEEQQSKKEEENRKKARAKAAEVQRLLDYEKALAADKTVREEYSQKYNGVHTGSDELLTEGMENEYTGKVIVIKGPSYEHAQPVLTSRVVIGDHDSCNIQIPARIAGTVLTRPEMVSVEYDRKNGRYILMPISGEYIDKATGKTIAPALELKAGQTIVLGAYELTLEENHFYTVTALRENATMQACSLLERFMDSKSVAAVERRQAYAQIIDLINDKLLSVPQLTEALKSSMDYSWKSALQWTPERGIDENLDDTELLEILQKILVDCATRRSTPSYKLEGATAELSLRDVENQALTRAMAHFEFYLQTMATAPVATLLPPLTKKGKEEREMAIRLHEQNENKALAGAVQVARFLELGLLSSNTVSQLLTKYQGSKKFLELIEKTVKLRAKIRNCEEHKCSLALVAELNSSAQGQALEDVYSTNEIVLLSQKFGVALARKTPVRELLQAMIIDTACSAIRSGLVNENPRTEATVLDGFFKAGLITYDALIQKLELTMPEITRDAINGLIEDIYYRVKKADADMREKATRQEQERRHDAELAAQKALWEESERNAQHQKRRQLVDKVLQVRGAIERARAETRLDILYTVADVIQSEEVALMLEKNDVHLIEIKEVDESAQTYRSVSAANNPKPPRLKVIATTAQKHTWRDVRNEYKALAIQLANQQGRRAVQGIDAEYTYGVIRDFIKTNIFTPQEIDVAFYEMEEGINLENINLKYDALFGKAAARWDDLSHLETVDIRIIADGTERKIVEAKLKALNREKIKTMLEERTSDPFYVKIVLEELVSKSVDMGLKPVEFITAEELALLQSES